MPLSTAAKIDSPECDHCGDRVAQGAGFVASGDGGKLADAGDYRSLRNNGAPLIYHKTCLGHVTNPSTCPRAVGGKIDNTIYHDQCSPYRAAAPITLKRDATMAKDDYSSNLLAGADRRIAQSGQAAKTYCDDCGKDLTGKHAIEAHIAGYTHHYCGIDCRGSNIRKLRAAGHDVGDVPPLAGHLTPTAFTIGSLPNLSTTFP